jgi:hypothetical protein
LKKISFVLLISLLFSVNLHAQEPGARPIPHNQWNKDVRLLLAKSCVGEAGWHSGTTGECAMLGYIYARRSKEIGMPFVNVITAYSAAIKKNHGLARHPWLTGLNARGDEPEHWPKKLRWNIHRPLWRRVLAAVDTWVRGETPNPIPKARHFGGWIDIKIAEFEHRWVRLCTPPGFRNRFYDSTQKYVGPLVKHKGQPACYLY